MQQNPSQSDQSQRYSEKMNDKTDVLLMLRNRIDCALAADATRIDVDCSIRIEAEQEMLVIQFKDNIFGEKAPIVFLNNQAKYYHQKFNHEVLKDYVMWFTSFGSIELEFGKKSHDGAVLFLKGLGREVAEEISFGHVFPSESSTPDILFEEHGMKTLEYYCKKYVKIGFLQHFPSISYEAVFFIEGDKIKSQYNPLLIPSGQENQMSAYTAQERYGVWLCNNYVPVERKNQWIMNRVIRSTDFHAFFNCPGLSVDAEKTSCEDTPTAILEDIKIEIKKIIAEILESDDQLQFEWLIYSVCSGL